MRPDVESLQKVAYLVALTLVLYAAATKERPERWQRHILFERCPADSAIPDTVRWQERHSGSKGNSGGPLTEVSATEVAVTITVLGEGTVPGAV